MQRIKERRHSDGWETILDRKSDATMPIKQAATTLNPQSILAFIRSHLGDSTAGGCNELRLIRSGRGACTAYSIVVDTLSTRVQRGALIDAVKEHFKHLMPYRKVPVEHSRDSDEWSVIDLGSVFVHVLDGEAEQQIGLRQHLASSANADAEEGSIDDEEGTEMIGELARGHAKRDMGRIAYIEQHLHRGSPQQ